MALAALLAVAPSAAAASLQWSASSEALHAGMPFTLTLSAQGFEEEPVPDAPALEIEGCEVVFLGVDPSVSSRIEIVNGRRSEWRDVSFHYRWRVTATNAGRYSVPPQRVEQNGVEARVAEAGFEVRDVPETEDMIVRLRLPERAVWVGETFDATVEWLLARDVDSYEFAVPLFDQDGVQVEPATSGAESVPFMAGAQQVRLPLRRGEVREGGRAYTRFSFPARITLPSVGALDLDPVRVVARLQSGTTRDAFGFRRPRYDLFKAQGERQRLTVRPLPQVGRPASFVNAIGEGFAIDVRASRTVVSVGEPIELVVSLRGAPPLTGLSLPPLDGPDALPRRAVQRAGGQLGGHRRRRDRHQALPGHGAHQERRGSRNPGLGVLLLRSSRRRIPNRAQRAPSRCRSVPVNWWARPTWWRRRCPRRRTSSPDRLASPIPGVLLLCLAPRWRSAIRSARSRVLGAPTGSASGLEALYGVPILVALVSLMAAPHARPPRARPGHSRCLGGGGVRARQRSDGTGGGTGHYRRRATPGHGHRHRHGQRECGAGQGREPAFDPGTAQQPLGGDDIEELRALARTWAGKGRAQALPLRQQPACWSPWRWQRERRTRPTT